jgi:hypothetical protein
MSEIHLITSIPPRISRVEHNKDVGTDYQIQCVHSWQESGFAPISVNSAVETVNQLSGVKFVTIPRDASSIAGKPLVFFHDMIRTSLELRNGPVVIANADILIDPSLDVCSWVRSIKPGEALLAKRIDVATRDSRSGSPYRWGFDFFAVHTSDLQRLPDFSLIFGAPWWDYFLPTVLSATGTKVHLLRQPFAYHLIHEDRFSRQLWTKMGVSYARQLQQFLSCVKTTESAQITQLLQRAFHNASKHRDVSLSSRIKEHLSWVYPARSNTMLRHLSLETVSFLEGTLISGGRNFAT